MFFHFVSDYKITTLANDKLTTDIMSNFPLLKFHFSVEWGGERIGFTEVTGLDFESEVIEYRHGAQPDYTSIKIPALKKSSNIIFKRGTFHGDYDFFQWYKTIYKRDYS